MENNTNGSTKIRTLRALSEKYVEPYVGMPIYLDDAFFESIDGDIGVECPIEDELENMKPQNGQMKPEDGVSNDMDTKMPIDCAKGCPVGMAYVPWQPWEEVYDMEDAFMIGTIFPCLDLPFLGGAAK